jgi:hypothetical protein
MDFISRKYTVLMGNEPLVLWIKDGQVQSAKFMDKRVQLQLDSEAVRLIKDNPTKIVNGNNLTKNENFTQSVSRMMSSKLELAIAKNDKKTLSRFARSELVPENMKHNFIQAINEQNGLRGVLTRAVNRTNAVFQNLAKKIDRFFEKVSDKIANRQLDPYLSEYQLKEFNKAPPITQEDHKKHLDPKLMESAERFFSENKIKMIYEDDLPQKILINEYLKKQAAQGHSIADAHLSLYKVQKAKSTESLINTSIDAHLSSAVYIGDLKKKLHVYEMKEASKNETIEDFKTLCRDIEEPSDRIDLLVKNKEYQNLSEEEKNKVEEQHIFKHEPILQRAEELQNIAEVVQAATPMIETVIDRSPTVDFLDKAVQSEITKKWSEQQKTNRENAEPTRDFMNISAVRFNGVNKDSLDKWADTAKSRDVAGATVIEKFVNATLRNAEELVKAGIMIAVEPNKTYKFVDNFAKQALYNNFNKTTAQIAAANQGKEVTREIAPQEELKERLESITSPESFEKLVTSNGKIDVAALQEYTDKIVSLSAAVHTQEKANVITREDLRAADQAHERSKSKEQGQAQAGGIER